ncbi:MAG: hypothetical protein MH204_08330 [Fimbriimonadaceae bacterium]|nr:hypothetical protein [Fimbriimonadaceae bacterium]
MTEFEVEPGVDLPLCAGLGMMFRWRMEDGVLLGAEGGFAWRVRRRDGGGWKVEGTGTEQDFRALFQLDLDLTQLDRLLAGLGEAPFPAGLRVIHARSKVETLFGFLCSQNNSLHRIRPMTAHLARLGDHAGPDWAPPAFPPVAVLAGIDPQALRQARFGYRAESIVRCAGRLLELGGETWLEDLGNLDRRGVRTALMSLPGVGPKLADCVCLFAYGHSDAVPVDTHVWAQAGPTHLPEEADRPLTPARAERLADRLRERYGTWAGWVQQGLFLRGLNSGTSRGSLVEFSDS